MKRFILACLSPTLEVLATVLAFIWFGWKLALITFLLEFAANTNHYYKDYTK